MKAMILAAGLGTRLKPLTDTRPKALVELSNRTLLEITLTRLRAFGVNEVIINVHHHADMVIDYLKSKNNFNLRIEISREEILLDTGGGLKRTSWFFLEDSKNLDEPFLLHNVDVLSTIDFTQMLQFHKSHRALATLAVQSRPSSRQLLFDNHLHLRSRASSTVTPDCAPQMKAHPNPSATASPAPPVQSAKPSHSERSEESVFSSNLPLVTSPSPLPPSPELSPLHPLAFSGIHLISPRLLPLLTETGIFSIIDSYLRLSSEGHPILAFRADHYYWRDLGRASDLTQAALDLQQNAIQY
jgi:NDP-sugar pyrophosphorylase family protein